MPLFGVCHGPKLATEPCRLWDGVLVALPVIRRKGLFGFMPIRLGLPTGGVCVGECAVLGWLWRGEEGAEGDIAAGADTGGIATGSAFVSAA